MSMATLPPPHTFLPGFERIKKLLQNKSGGSGPPHSPPWLRPCICPKYNRVTEGGRTFNVTAVNLLNSLGIDLRKKNKSLLV